MEARLRHLRDLLTAWLPRVPISPGRGAKLALAGAGCQMYGRIVFANWGKDRKPSLLGLGTDTAYL
jgi:hypothetical protein